MKKNTVLLLPTLLIFNYVVSLEIPRIAIIGGGIGGASTSHFLTELLNGNLKIDLYEAKTIGGRLATIKIDNYNFEAGGSIIHSKNMYMQRFATLLDLKKLSVSGSEKMGVWTGDEFAFTEGDWSVVNIVQLFFRYGYQVFKLKWHVDKILDSFMRIYDLQDAGRSFDNVTALLSAMDKDFPQLLRISVKDYLLREGFGEKLIDELVQASIVANYGENVNIQSFVSLVSLAAGTADKLWSVKGGNKLVPKHLIYGNKHVNVVPGRVTKICYLADTGDSGRYEVTYVNKDITDNTDPATTSSYDIVIVATPLTRDQAFPIEFAGFPVDLTFPGTFQTTHATFVEADLNTGFFGLSDALDAIISCDPNKTRISAIGRQNPVDEPTTKDLRVWKIFSREPVDDLISKMFSNV